MSTLNFSPSATRSVGLDQAIRAIKACDGVLTPELVEEYGTADLLLALRELEKDPEFPPDKLSRASSWLLEHTR